MQKKFIEYHLLSSVCYNFQTQLSGLSLENDTQTPPPPLPFKKGQKPNRLRNVQKRVMIKIIFKKEFTKKNV